MPRNRGDPPEEALRPPPQPPILQPSPRHSKPAIFSLTPLSSTSSSSHHSNPQSPDESPERPDDSPVSSNPPSAARFLSPSEPQSPQDASPTSFHGSMLTGDQRPNGRTTPPPTKSRSILNLTSSTLLGIYSPSGYDANRDEIDTPWGSGAQTPALRNGGPIPSSDSVRSLAEGLREKTLQQLRDPSYFSTRDYSRRPSGEASPTSQRQQHQPHGKRRRKAPSWPQFLFGVLWRVAALFLLGMVYGGVVTHLHDSRQIAPVKVDINRGSWYYLTFWGVIGVVLGFMLPWVDEQWGNASHEEHEKHDDMSSETGKSDRRPSEDSDTEHSGAEWNPIVRSVGAFVGIAFAIRRLPWQSTLQVSLTLALVNPVIWYLLDRTRTGVALSFVTAITGATAMMRINPNIVPSPAPSPAATFLNRSMGHGAGGAGVLGLSLESIGVATWIGSVFFCSCVCFGNVGRRLARGVA